MVLKVFSVFDTKLSTYMTPFFQTHAGQAERMFSQIVNDNSAKDNMLAAHPEDFTLFEMGSVDLSSGRLDSLSTPHSIATALSVRKSVSEAPFLNS